MLKPKPISDAMRRAHKLNVSAPRLFDEEITAGLLVVEQALLAVLERDSHVVGWLDELEKRVADAGKAQ